MQINFTNDQKRRLIHLYGVNNASDIQYDTIINKYIFFIEKYLSSDVNEFCDPDYLYSFNNGCYFLLDHSFYKDTKENISISDDIQRISFKLQGGEYASLNRYEKILFLMAQIQQRFGQPEVQKIMKQMQSLKQSQEQISIQEEMQMNLADMSYLMQCVYQTEKKMNTSKRALG